MNIGPINDVDLPNCQYMPPPNRFPLADDCIVLFEMDTGPINDVD